MPQAATPPAAPALTDDVISVETQDDLIKQAVLARLRFSMLLQLVRDKYGVNGLGQLHNAQAVELADELRQRFEAGRRGDRTLRLS